MLPPSNPATRCLLRQTTRKLRFQQTPRAREIVTPQRFDPLVAFGILPRYNSDTRIPPTCH
ncbi:hypothetical protein K443DRAFT_679263 [Laccaria amethystina LaAM-08-1]|uniref:Unplaced genomic scaffold K443scaffold_94, whole genome shotgun sequence n=1 Tax=Laccaria amethystina LaAM-08-1 TaxID=1095629 RepID=A0A0C9XRB7_9AGAR|nr:hypothetical protein K443DRAFT_679263 [Laccaria amethystina LaAM-08-1]